MNKYTEFLQAMSEAPDGQLCKTQADKCASLAKQGIVKSSDIKQILDDCAYAALASEFSMLVLHHIWKQILEDEGKV